MEKPRTFEEWRALLRMRETVFVLFDSTAPTAHDLVSRHIYVGELVNVRQVRPPTDADPNPPMMVEIEIGRLGTHESVTLPADAIDSVRIESAYPVHQERKAT